MPWRRMLEIMPELGHFIKNKYGVTLKYQLLDNDQVKSFDWTFDKLIDWLLEGDIHFLITHPHQGNLTFTRDSWNMSNILNQLCKLKLHFGFPRFFYFLFIFYL